MSQHSIAWMGRVFVLLAAWIACCSDASSGSKDQSRTPIPAAKGLASDGQLRIGEDDQCPVCAMKPKHHSKFACAIELTDGRTFYFCGTGCMLRSYLHPKVYLGAGKDSIARVRVKDYFDGRQMDGRKAVWIAGSDVVGPMGLAFVPLRNDADARIFQQRHGGKHRFIMGSLDDAKWRDMTGKSPTGPPK
ncbi:MAG: nitrous oxide reductase accessory protein NosL [Myxococcota bacterium]|nr:nitrous oxide reductase accessory protein NosL [Myxococcota bacterium]